MSTPIPSPHPSLRPKQNALKFGFFSVSLRVRLLIFLWGLTFLALILIATVSFDTVARIGTLAEQLGGQALTAQAKNNLVEYNAAVNQQLELFFSQIENQARVMSKFVSSAYEAQLSGQELQNDPTVGLTKLNEGQYSNSASAVSSLFVPNFVRLNDSIRIDVRNSAELDELFPAIHEQFPSVVALFFATPNQLTRYFPNIQLGGILPADWKVTGRPWFIQAVESNPPRPWVDPYLDATGKGLVTTVAVPVLAEEPPENCPHCPKEGTLLGVIGMDVTLDELKKTAEKSNLLPGNSYTFIIDGGGRGIVMPDQSYLDITGAPAKPDQEIINLSEPTNSSNNVISNEFRPVIQDMRSGKTGIVEVNIYNGSGNIQRTVIVAYTFLKTTGWSLGSVVDPIAIVKPLETLKSTLAESYQRVAIQRVLPLLAVVMAVILVLSIVLTNQWIKPIRLLADAALKIGQGNWEVTLPGEENILTNAPNPNTRNEQDEISILKRAFIVMKNQVYASLTALESRVQDRTQELEKRNRQLQAASELAREITQTSIQQPGQFDDLLNKAVNLISQRFGFYHVSLFLVDENREYAILNAATGEIGQKLIDRKHKLRIGVSTPNQPMKGLNEKDPIGIVGFVAGTGKPRIALDTGLDIIHFKNPLLPETRSEMALPLKSAANLLRLKDETPGKSKINSASSTPMDSTFGVLDVQSKSPNAFDEQDIAVIQILADQLAVAIENARLFKTYQENLSELETLYKRLNMESWSKLLDTRPVLGYEVSEGALAPILSDKIEDHKTQSPFYVPIKIRGKSVAGLEIWPSGSAVAPIDQKLITSISEHLSQALEAARLYEEAQTRAFREQAINRFVAELSQSLDLETLLRSAAQQLGKLPNVAEVTIQLAPSSESGGDS